MHSRLPETFHSTQSHLIFFMCLRVQLGKSRMKMPCRSVTCDHLQCFDAVTYLRMNEKKPTWFCPVCDRHAEYSKLIIDGFVCCTSVCHVLFESVERSNVMMKSRKSCIPADSHVRPFLGFVSLGAFRCA